MKVRMRVKRSFKDSKQRVNDSRNNNVRNPIFNQLTAVINDANARNWHAVHLSNTDLLTHAEVKSCVSDLIRTVDILRSVGVPSMYLGTTGRSLPQEDLRFLTTRGANQMHLTNPKKGKRNRPVLRWCNGAYITMKEARELGFISLILWTGTFRKDATAIEEGLQRHYNTLPLGDRLWRSVAKGAKISDELSNLRIYHVF